MTYKMSTPTSSKVNVTNAASVELVSIQNERSHVLIQNPDTGDPTTNAQLHVAIGRDATTNDPILEPGGDFEIGQDNYSFLSVNAIGAAGAPAIDVFVSVNMIGIRNPAQTVALRASDIEIGAVEIKDGVADTRATVKQADDAPSTSDKLVGVRPVNEKGKVIVGGGGVGGGGNQYYSPDDFSMAYTSAVTLTLDGLRFVPTTGQFQYVEVVLASGLVEKYTPDSNAFAYDAPTKVLTVTDANFLGTDTEYNVCIFGPLKEHNQAGNFKEAAIVNYRLDHPLHPVHIDTTNLAGPNNYPYPGAAGFPMKGYSNFSLGYEMVDLELEVYGRNFDGFAWKRITGMAYDSRTKLYGADIIGAAGATVAGTLHFEGLDLKEIYCDIESFDATNVLKLDGRLSVPA